jgi:hypothetical protein
MLEGKGRNLVARGPRNGKGPNWIDSLNIYLRTLALRRDALRVESLAYFAPAKNAFEQSVEHAVNVCHEVWTPFPEGRVRTDVEIAPFIGKEQRTHSVPDPLRLTFRPETTGAGLSRLRYLKR